MSEPVKASWADEIEDNDSSVLPLPSEEVSGNIKTVTEYRVNEAGQKVKVVRTYRIERKLVPKAIAQRRTWAKFGMSRSDKTGPNPQTTVVAEEVGMQFVSNKKEGAVDREQKPTCALDKATNKGMIKCRICKDDHWTTQCPYKDTLGPLKASLSRDPEQEAGIMTSAGGGSVAAAESGKYVLPNKRGGGSEARAGDSVMPDRRRDDTAAIRISNLSEDVQEFDLAKLVTPFGNVARMFLARDKVTQLCKGFAFVNYYRKEDAAKAIGTLNGHGYDHLFLAVEWARPSADR